jgi:hypothetical protein
VRSLRSILLLVLSIELAGCSASVSVKPVPVPSGDTPQVVNGVPFRVPGQYTIHVYRLNKDNYEEIRNYVRTLPDPDELYAVNFSAKALSDQKVNLKFRSDSTLSELNLSGAAQKVDEAITAIGTQAVGAFSAFQNRELTTLEAANKEAEARKALADAEAALDTSTGKPAIAQEDALVAALTALNAARKAENELNDLPATATASERAAKEDALRLERLRANVAYRRAGLAVPFPDAFP